jgi:hypothetical protein
MTPSSMRYMGFLGDGDRPLSCLTPLEYGCSRPVHCGEKADYRGVRQGHGHEGKYYSVVSFSSLHRPFLPYLPIQLAP